MKKPENQFIIHNIYLTYKTIENENTFIKKILKKELNDGIK